MEGNVTSGNMNLGGSSYGGLDLQTPNRPHYQHHQLSLNQQHQSLFRQNSIVNQPIHENFPLSMGNCDLPMPLSDFSKGEKGKSSASEEDEPSFTEDMFNCYDDGKREKKGVQWHRVKWADKMVKLLITAVSYVGEDATGRSANLQKKGKWKLISKVMAERGHLVSPQQCEDKFNDLNKRYKRLNEILGRGTSCEVVEKPELLDVMHNLSEKAKEEVKKILSSKQLFYEEMCSYHNKNRLRLPHDLDLQRSLRLVNISREENEHNDFGEDDHDAEVESHDDYEENNVKKMKSCLAHGDFSFVNSEFNKNFGSQIVRADINKSFSDNLNDNEAQKLWIKHRSLELEEQSLQIQAQMLELERDRFKWERYCRKGDRELDLRRAENEKMKLENEHLRLELKKKEMSIDRE